MNDKLTKLIHRAIDGDTTAFEQIMELKAREIIYVCVKLLRSQQDGEDAAQEAMLKMYQNMDTLKSPESFRSWMYQIVSRTCIDMKRKLKREDHDYLDTEVELNEERREFLPQDYIDDVAKRDVLMEIIDQLPDNYRACLLFFYFEELTYQEIAEIMGISTKVVDNSLLRAKKRIRRQLEEQYGEINPRAIFQGAVALPVLSQVFQQDALLRVSPETIEGLLATAHAAALGVGVKLTGGAAVAAETAGQTAATSTSAATSGSAAASSSVGTSSAASAATTAGLGTTAKVIIGTVAAVTTIGASAYLFDTSNTALAEYGDQPPAQEEALILTLEDMIGQEAADILRAYTRSEEAASRWPDFIDQLEMTVLSGITVDEEMYTLYHQQKQDKQLMILEMQDGDRLEVVFRFTDSDEEPPKKGELFRSLEGWRQ